METLIETFFGSVLAFLFGIGSGCSLGLLSTVLLAESIGQNVISAVVPFALLHTAVFITALTMAIGMNLEIAEIEVENLFPGLLINLLSKTFNTLRHAQPLTIIGAVIMCFWVAGCWFGDSENEVLCLGQWGMIIAITSELKTPKTAILTMITGVAMMAFGSTDGQQEYGNVAFILYILLIMPLMIPFDIVCLPNIIAQSAPVLDRCAAILALTTFFRLRGVVCFVTHIISQYLGLIKAVFKTMCVFVAIVMFSFIIALLLIFVGLLPHSFWGEDDNARSLQIMVKTLCWYSFFFDISNIKAAELGLQVADVKAVQRVFQMFAILDAVITLAVIYGIAVLVRVQTPRMEARGELILAWTGTGATLAVALAVWMVHGQAMLLKGLAVSVLISACLFFIFKITMQSINMRPLCNNAPEVVQQLGSIYVAILMIGLGVALMPVWIGWACVVIGILLAINTIQLIPLLDQDIPEDIDENEE